jgi:hypothetical protein
MHEISLNVDGTSLARNGAINPITKSLVLIAAFLTTLER